MTNRDRNRREMGLITGYLRELRQDARATVGGVDVGKRHSRAMAPAIARRASHDSLPAQGPGGMLKMTA